MLMRARREADAGTLLRASLACARELGTRSWELRCATTLAGLLADHDDRAAARDVLAPAYEWFTEGFDTRDLIEARRTLETLGV
jgi:hypothetical protein